MAKGNGKNFPHSGRRLDSFLPNTVKCSNCGKTIERRESLCDYRLKNSAGSYCRFCKDCAEIFERTVQVVDDPTGLIFPEGIEVDLGDKDPFFKIRFYAGQGELPSWKVVPHDQDAGGLLVFVRRVGSYVKAEKIGDKPKLTCKIKITKKSTKVAFAEPYFDASTISEEDRIQGLAYHTVKEPVKSKPVESEETEGKEEEQTETES